jgi:hypothetical protein
VERGPDFVLFTNFCGVNTPNMADLRLRTWCQLAYKITGNFWAIASKIQLQLTTDTSPALFYGN